MAPSGVDTDVDRMPKTFPAAVIRSKLYRPVIANDVVERRRLLDLASAAHGNPVTLVSAQAGYGKSTLVSQWLSDSDVESAWLSLDSADADISRFLTYVVTAIRTIYPDNCQEISEYLRMASDASPEDLAGALINDLDQIDGRFTLVLDGYDQLGASPVHEFLDSLLRHPPRAMHLVLITRRDPPLSLQPLRASGLLTEIRMRDLLFTEAESSAFISNCLGNDVPQAALSRLHQATDGWPVALRLAILAAPEADAIDSFALEIPGNIREIRDYLVTEVLAKQSPGVRDALLRTSFLDKFNAALCGAVIGEPDDGSASSSGHLGGEEFLDHVRESGLLCIDLDDKHEWYRYHNLFQSMLQGQANEKLGETAVNNIHFQASQWLERHGYLEESIRHMIAGDGAVAAGELIARHRNQILNLEQHYFIKPWLDLLPPDIVEESPGLMIIRARVQQSLGTFEETWRILDAVDDLLDSKQLDPRKKRELKGSAEAIRCYHHFLSSRSSSAVKSAEYALQHLPADCFTERGFAMTIMVGALQMAGRLDLAKNFIYDALAKELPAENDSKTRRVRLLVTLGYMNWMNADLTGLRSVANELAETDGSHEMEETLLISRFHQATVLYHDENLTAASSTLEKVMKYKSISNIRFFFQCAFISALAMQEQGRPVDASNVARFALEFALKHQSKPMILMSEAFVAELAMRQGRFSEALEWARTYDPGPFMPMYEFYSPLITLAKVLVADDSAANRSRALHFLDEFSSYLEGIHNKRFLIEVLAIRSMLFEATGDRDAATRDLTTAVSLALPGRFIRLFVDLGPRLTNLFSTLDLNEEMLVYVGEILAAFRQAADNDGSRARSNVTTFYDDQSGVDPLTKREQQVLTLLAGRLSNKEIADDLNISVVTVKRHAANIYEKLDVHGRKRAVAKATGLGLIRQGDT